MDHPSCVNWATKYIYPIAKRLGVTVDGIENIPKDGTVILFANHGGWITVDTSFCHSIITKSLGENITAIVHSILFKIPGIGDVLRNIGALPVNKLNDIDFIKSYSRVFFIAPEGADGTSKPFYHAYKLRPFRPGFIRLAIKLKAKLIPSTIIGNEDIFPVLLQADFFKKIIGAPLGIPITFIPLPISKIHCRLYPPIDMSVYDPALADNKRFCMQLAEKLRCDLQKRLDEHASRQPLFLLNKVIGWFLNEGHEQEVIKSHTSKKSLSRK